MAAKAKKSKKKTTQRCVTFNVMATDAKKENWSEEMAIDIWFTGKIHAKILAGEAVRAIQKAAPGFVTGKVIDTTICS